MSGIPSWFREVLGVSEGVEEFNSDAAGIFRLENSIYRSQSCLTESQNQTKDSFGFKWAIEDSFDSEASCERMKTWLKNKYGDISSVLNNCPDNPVVLDAGCGAGFSFLDLWAEYLSGIRYIGVDVSSAVDVAKKRFLKRGFSGAAFLQSCLTNLPLQRKSLDVIFSEGVLHHTDNTEHAFKALSEYLKPGGYFMFYVYKKKAPVREFTDDFIREQLQALSSAEAWEKLKPLTKLGIQLGELNTTINIKEDIDVLGIKAGEINLQRLFYWYVFKAFYDPNLSFDEMHNINFDWYAPKNAHRHTPEEVLEWCQDMQFEIEHTKVEDAGITVVARKR